MKLEDNQQETQTYQENPDTSGKKYEFTGKTRKFPSGTILQQIRRLSDGVVGGWIEKEGNLSHEGDCWVGENAHVFGNTQVFGNAWVYEDARVYGNARVYENAQVFRNAKVYENALISGNAQVYGSAWVSGNARVYGSAWVFGNAQVHGHARVYGNARVFGDAQVSGNAQVYGYARVFGSTQLSEGTWVSGDTKHPNNKNTVANIDHPEWISARARDTVMGQLESELLRQFQRTTREWPVCDKCGKHLSLGYCHEESVSRAFLVSCCRG